MADSIIHNNVTYILSRQDNIVTIKLGSDMFVTMTMTKSQAQGLAMDLLDLVRA